LAMSVASGMSWLGKTVAVRGPALYIDAEGSDQRSRVRAWKESHGVAESDRMGVQFWRGPLDLGNEILAMIFRANLRSLRPQLIIVDTLARTIGAGDENSARDQGALIRQLDAMRLETGATVVILHHTNKAGTAERGSGALRGAS